MKRPFVFVILLVAATQSAAQPVTKSKQPLITGEARIIHSVILNEDRLLNVSLPDSFSQSKSYPVFYLLDGSLNEDFLHIAGLLQFFHLSYGMPDCIVVGIANVDRKRDFTFSTTVEDLKKTYPTTGHSEAFIRFLDKELKPYIESVYRTNGLSYLIGQSLGGLVAVEILLKHPEIFTHYLVVSPSLWWDNESLLGAADSLIQKRGRSLENKEIFITVGGKEDPVMQRDAGQLAGKLDSAGKFAAHLHFITLPGENHATVLHQAIDEDLKKLFPLRNE